MSVVIFMETDKKNDKDCEPRERTPEESEELVNALLDSRDSHTFQNIYKAWTEGKISIKSVEWDSPTGDWDIKMGDKERDLTELIKSRFGEFLAEHGLALPETVDVVKAQRTLGWEICYMSQRTDTGQCYISFWKDGKRENEKLFHYYGGDWLFTFESINYKLVSGKYLESGKTQTETYEEE